MLSRQHRLRAMRDFRHLFKHGRLHSSSFLQVRVVKTAPNAPVRTAFIISAKTAKSAVDRNRAKRQSREIVRTLLPRLASGHDLSFTMKRPFLTLSFADKTRVMSGLLKKARLLK